MNRSIEIEKSRRDGEPGSNPGRIPSSTREENRRNRFSTGSFSVWNRWSERGMGGRRTRGCLGETELPFFTSSPQLPSCLGNGQSSKVSSAAAIAPFAQRVSGGNSIERPAKVADKRDACERRRSRRWPPRRKRSVADLATDSDAPRHGTRRHTSRKPFSPSVRHLIDTT